MSGRSDEVQKYVHTVILEARITLDPRLFGQNVIVLALEVFDDLGKAGKTSADELVIFCELLTLPRCRSGRRNPVYPQWSRRCEYLPRPARDLGVNQHPMLRTRGQSIRTDGDGLDLDALFEMGVGWVIRVLAFQHLLAAEGIDESGATCDGE